MRPLSLIRLSFLFLFTVTFFSCSDKKEQLETDLVSDYLPLQTGKYITYRLDSLVFVDFQQFPEVHSYLVKHVVDAQVTDNLGRPSYRIARYLNNSGGTDNWVPNGTYFITPLDKQTEVVEDNLRVIKLHAPVTEGFNWKGNSYLPDEPYSSFGYVFENDNDMQKWDFNYDAFESTFSYGGMDYTDVHTVEEQADSINVPITAPQSYASKSRSVEKYAKNIGLVYREFTLWEYQPNPGGPHPAYSGFGITMWMVDHN